MRHTNWLWRALGIFVLALAVMAATGCGSADDKDKSPEGTTPEGARAGDAAQGEGPSGAAPGPEQPPVPDPFSPSEPEVVDPFAAPEPEGPGEAGPDMPPVEPVEPEVPGVGIEPEPPVVPPAIEPEPGGVPPVVEPEPGFPVEPTPVEPALPEPALPVEPGVGPSADVEPGPGPEPGSGVVGAEPGPPPPGPPDEEPGEGDLRAEVEAELRERAEPLVENREALKPLSEKEKQPIWLDMKNSQVVMVGRVCQTDAPLELFACLKDTKEHEAVLTIDVEAIAAHAGLLALGAEPGNPVSWDPVYKPASGTEIDVLVRWKDAEGNVKNARAQDWVYDVENEKAMDHPWVFAGSGFWVDEGTGRKHYKAEGGDFICVSNFSSAMLDLPIESSQANNALMFKAYTERIPPRGTPVTVLLRPKLDKQEKKKPDAAPEE